MTSSSIRIVFRNSSRVSQPGYHRPLHLAHAEPPDVLLFSPAERLFGRRHITSAPASIRSASSAKTIPLLLSHLSQTALPRRSRLPGPLDAITAIIGKNIPYLNGGIFAEHQIESDHPDIHIPDEAFEKIFDFFDEWNWHLDDRPLSNGNEINPEVLGYVFEKYTNQKEMGAYYTKEDITGYISKNTILPFLLREIAAKLPGGAWDLLKTIPTATSTNPCAAAQGTTKRHGGVATGKHRQRA